MKTCNWKSNICAFAFALLASNFAYAVTADFDLNSNGTKETIVESNVTAPFICTPCTITYIVDNGLIGGDQKFNWTGPGFAGTAKGPTPAGTRIPTSTAFTTYLSVVEDVGNISFAPAGVAGPANYHKPVVSGVVYYAGELKALLFKSPANIEFAARLTELGPDSFEYTYTVTNHLPYSITFSWIEADFSRAVSGNTSVSRRFTSSQPAIEVAGSASFTIDDGDYIMPAHVWTPIAVAVPIESE